MRKDNPTSNEIGSLSGSALRLLQAYNELSHSSTQKLDDFSRGITEAAATLKAQVSMLPKNLETGGSAPQAEGLSKQEVATKETGVSTPFPLLDLGSRKIGVVNASSSKRTTEEKNEKADSENSSTWTVPPRVLLVEDDAMCRKLSSKLLQIFGCKFDVATDGVAAVNKMNLVKYDMVLMVRPHYCDAETLIVRNRTLSCPIWMVSRPRIRSVNSTS